MFRARRGCFDPARLSPKLAVFHRPVGPFPRLRLRRAPLRDTLSPGRICVLFGSRALVPRNSSSNRVIVHRVSLRRSCPEKSKFGIRARSPGGGVSWPSAGARISSSSTAAGGGAGITPSRNSWLACARSRPRSNPGMHWPVRNWRPSGKPAEAAIAPVGLAWRI